MKLFTHSLALVSSLLIVGCGDGSISGVEGEVSDVKAPYLGQTPPGLTPKQFAPELVSTGNLEIEGVFAPGMKEFYFTRQVTGNPVNTHAVTYENGEWSQSLVGPRVGEVAISTDGNIMYLGNQYKQRTASGWSEAKSLGPEFEQFPIMRLTASAAGTYVFDERDEIGTIRFSRLIDGKRQAPEVFDKQINSGAFTSHPFIAPDESYLIWDSERDGGYGDSDLYISFREIDGSWGPAINMGEEINTEFEDAYGSVTPDGKYFFFHTINLVESASESSANIYWVDAQIIENLRPK